jgi:hypothetical protein
MEWRLIPTPLTVEHPSPSPIAGDAGRDALYIRWGYVALDRSFNRSFGKIATNGGKIK